MNYQPRKLDVTEITPRPLLSDISIVIPTLGRPILEESLYWIAHGSAWPGALIVVDQGRNPQVAAWLAALETAGMPTLYLPSAQRGRAAGVNRGLERAATPFVTVTDDDCFVAHDWLENMAAQLRNNPQAIVTGRVEAGTDDVIIVVTDPTPYVQRRPRLTFDRMSGGNMGTSSAVLARTGLFDEDPRVRTAEDAEFAYRALQAGVILIYAPEVCVRHFGWRGESQRYEQYRDYARSHGGFYGKYLRQGDAFIALRATLHHLRALRRWWRGVRTRDQETADLGRAYTTGLLPGILAGLRGGNGP